MNLKNFYGTTNKALHYYLDKDEMNKENRLSISHFFFQPYGSAKNVAVRTTSIITDLLILTSYSAAVLPAAVSYLFKAISYFLYFEFSKAADKIKNCAICLMFFPVFLFLAAVSPLINLVDLGGSAVSTVKNRLSSKEEKEHLRREDNDYSYS